VFGTTNPPFGGAPADRGRKEKGKRNTAPWQRGVKAFRGRRGDLKGSINPESPAREGGPGEKLANGAQRSGERGYHGTWKACWGGLHLEGHQTQI